MSALLSRVVELNQRVERALPSLPPLAGRLWIAFLIGSLLALPFALNLALGNSLGRDEHQHIAAGVLFARDGLMPYRDFSIFHVPYLVWLYGAIFQLTDHYLLATRLVSAACASMTVGMVCGIAWSLFPGHATSKRAIIALGAMLAVITPPLFTEVVGHSWNQEPSVLFILLAFGLLLTAPARKSAGWPILLAGLATGVAAGFRVTVLPMVLPFAIMAWLSAPADTTRLRFLVLFFVGLSLGLLPVLYAFVAAPEGFVFGNIEFPKVNIEYRFATGEPRTMTLLKKLRYLFKEIMRPNGALFFGFIALVLAAKFAGRQKLCSQRTLLFVFLSIPFLLMGALAPSPAYKQYFYPLVPFLVIGSLAVLAMLPKGTRTARIVGIGAFVIVTILSVRGLGKYEELTDVGPPSRWAVIRHPSAIKEIRDAVGQGRVLTLIPGWAVEAGLQIYPEFVTGPFAWRVAPFVATERHRKLHLLAPDDLVFHLNANPPAAILTGLNKQEERLLLRYASDRGFRKTPLTNGNTLWLAPK